LKGVAEFREIQEVFECWLNHIRLFSSLPQPEMKAMLEEFL